MEAPEIADFARNFSVMVRVQGPDPKGLKMRRNAFHLHRSGNTAISASGLLLPASSLSQIPTVIEYILKFHQFSGALVITVASIVQPFLIAEQRHKLTLFNHELSPILIHNASIDVLVEGVKRDDGHDESCRTSKWLPAKLLALVDAPAASDALLSLVGNQSSWEASWSLAPFSSSQILEFNGFDAKDEDDEGKKGVALDGSNNLILMSKSITRIAFLGIPNLNNKDGLCLNVSQHQKRGDLIVVLGSPFGVLSPQHFHNSVSVGIVANYFPSGSEQRSLLVPDIRCLPGMEGGPVFDRQACLAGILTKPIRQIGSNAEIQFAVTWNAICSMDIDSFQLKAQSDPADVIERVKHNSHVISSDRSCNYASHKHLIGMPVISSAATSSLEAAITSVVLIAVGERSWASGIVLNKDGLILTNAHALDSWRYERSSMLGLSVKADCHTDFKASLHRQEFSAEKAIEGSIIGHKEPFFGYDQRSSKTISVRVDFMKRKRWYSARAIYVSRGPLDIALLQLESAPPLLQPISPQTFCPSQGSAVYIIGHGLLGPRSNISAFVSSGVLSNIVLLPRPIHINESGKGERKISRVPIMLQTTAAVHPGASGGAIIDSNGCMIGLVTSNARHGRGAIIPHLNFSIPCEVLGPVFKYSDTQDASVLEVLDKPNDLISSVWALVPSESKKEQPELISDDSKEGKGSRFLQFLAENKAEIASLKDLNHFSKMDIKSKI